MMHEPDLEVLVYIHTLQQPFVLIEIHVNNAQYATSY